MSDRQVPADINRCLRTWEFSANLLRTLHITLGAAAICFSILVVQQANSTGTTYIQVYAIGSAISVGLMSGFNLGEKANRTRRAWRRLNAARLRYLSQEDFSVAQLIDAYSLAESEIGDVKENPVEGGK